MVKHSKVLTLEMTTTLFPEAVTGIQKLIEDACANEHACLPCATVVVVGKGESPELFAHSARMRGQDQDDGMIVETTTPSCDDIHWLASCTKLVTGIACMQLVEQGKLGFDDSDQVEQLCPELAGVKILQEDGSLVDPRSRITLRMLLTHTGEQTLFMGQL